MKSRDSVVNGSLLAWSQWRRRAKSSACLRRVTLDQVEPKVAVYSAINGVRATDGRLSCLRGNPTNEACGGVSTPSCVRVSMALYYVSLALPATIFKLDGASKGPRMPPRDDQFRVAIRDVLARSGLSMRALSAAMGRDPGYIAALLDPTRPSRTRPTPADLLAASDATGIAFVELLESLWGIEPDRLSGELRGLGQVGGSDKPMRRLTRDERALEARRIGGQ